MAVRWRPTFWLAVAFFCQATAAEDALESDVHWAFVPLERPAVPTVRDDDHWIRTSVDAFIFARLEAEGLRPSPTAPRHILLRRLWANLVGLPPGVEEAAWFSADSAPGAYERMVEQLLASPHYGERWARHWLDVARYAESTGFVENHDKPHFYRYRDWVLQSFNDDKPYDVFITQQVAGDELRPYADENVIATGFLAAARLSSEELSCVRQEDDMYVDIVNATSSAVLGLTMGCAQCHDHMFDPLKQRDYYRLQAFFIRGYPGNIVLGGKQVAEEVHTSARNFHDVNLTVRRRILAEGVNEGSAELQRLWATTPAERTLEEAAALRVHKAALNIRIAGCNGFRISKEERKRLDEAKAAIDKLTPQLSQTWAFYSPVTSPHRLSTLLMAGNFPLIHDRHELTSRRAYLHARGDPYQPDELVTPGFPEVLRAHDRREQSDPKGEAELTRVDLARWLTNRHNAAGALAARVWVNRIWHYHFGRGLVATPGNFGTRGAPPTHPDLLEHLAAELIDSGWSTKHVQRLIVNSSAYRQSTNESPQAIAASTRDPENRFYWRWPMRRLEAEAIRDMMLAVSDQIDLTVGGPSVPQGLDSGRRSLYLFQKRDVPGEMPALFDGPTAMSASCAQRQVSTSALQPLFLLNSPKTAAWASAFAEKVESAAPDDRRAQINLSFQRALAREPGRQELAEAERYLTVAAGEALIDDGTCRIVAVEFAANRQQPPAPGQTAPSIVATQPSQPGQYVLHQNGFTNHTPDPETATVTYTFDKPTTVADVEMIVHVNGIVRIEGFVGDSIESLESIGEATHEAAARDKQFPQETGVYPFVFDEEWIRPGNIFRFVVRETVKADRFANYQAYPHDADKRRIVPTPDVVPDDPRPMSPLARLCQALMNLNEFIYVP